MRTTRGRDRAIAGPTRFTGPRQIGTGDNPGLVPTLGLNFLVDYLTPAVSFSRASNATMFDSLGRLVWAPHNLLANSAMVGAVVPSTPPTNWILVSSANIAVSLVEAEPNRIVVRFTGTAGGSAEYPNVQMANATISPAAVNGQSHTVSCTITRVVVAAGQNSVLNLAYRDSGSTVIPGQESTVVPTPGVRARYSTGRTATDAAVARAQARYMITVAAGQFVDEYITLEYPQTELTSPGSPLAYVQSATGGAYYGPRFDYNPATLAPRGLLFEVQRTNLQPTYQGVAGDWSGTFGGISSTGAVILGNPALTFTVNSTAGAQFAFITAVPAVLAASTVYTSSVRVKRGNHPRVQFTCTVNAFQPTVADAYLNYNFDTDTLVVAGSALPAPTGTRFVCADGSVILTLTFTSGTAPTAGAAGIIAFVDSDAAIRFAGTTTNGATVHMFGMQIEAGAFATSLIPTFGTAATRSGDVADLVSAPPWNPTGMTIAVQFERQGTPISSSGEATSASFYWGDVNDYVNGVFGFGTPTQVRSDVGRAGTPEVQVSVSTQPNTPFQVYKWATRLASNDAQMYANGVAGTPDTVVTLPTTLGVARYAIGRSNAATAQQMHGWLRGLQVYTSALSNTQLQTLST